MKIGCVVVLYHPDDTVICNIKSYIEYFDKVYLIDNTEDTRLNDDVFLQNKNVCYIASYENIGLPAALNIGLKQLKLDGFSYAVTMDQDTKYDESPIDFFNFCINTPDNVAVIGPQYKIDRLKMPVKSETYDEILFSMTSSSFFKLEIMDKLGYFDEKLFLDTLDAEYCLRAKENGYKTIRYNNFIVEHHPAITKKTRIFRLKYGYCSPIRIYYQNRNGYYCLYKYKNKLFKKGILKRYIKIIFLFPNKVKYLNMMKKGRKDAKNNIFGKYNNKK